MGSAFGDVYEVFSSPAPHARSLKSPRDRFAAIKFRTQIAANKFIEAYHGFNLRGSILNVVPSRTISDIAVDCPPPKETNDGEAKLKKEKQPKPQKKKVDVAPVEALSYVSLRPKRVLDNDNELQTGYVCTPTQPRNGPILEGNPELEACVAEIKSTGLLVEEALVDDERLSLFRMKLARDPDVYSRAVKEALDRKAYLVAAPSMKVVKRCLAPMSRSVVELLMTSPENLIHLKDDIIAAYKRGGITGPILVLPADDVERVKGIPLTRENAVSAMCKVDARIIKTGITHIDPFFDLTLPTPEYDPTNAAELCGKRPLTLPFLVLDDVRSGDNVGALLRSAFSLGVQSVLMTKTSFSGLGMRSMRVSMGSASHCTFAICEDLPAVLKELVDRGVDVIATSPTAREVLTPLPTQNWALIVGNEDVGSSEETFNASSRKIKLVQSGGDSFSVSIAASICLYMLRENALDANAEFIPDV